MYTSVIPNFSSFLQKAGLKNFDTYFREMENITRTKQDQMPSRVRFMIQDVIDLRRNNWKPRREKAGPKTLDQIHQEAEREKMGKTNFWSRISPLNCDLPNQQNFYF